MIFYSVEVRWILITSSHPTKTPYYEVPRDHSSNVNFSGTREKHQAKHRTQKLLGRLREVLNCCVRGWWSKALCSGYHYSLPCLRALSDARIHTCAGVLRCNIMAAQVLVGSFKIMWRLISLEQRVLLFLCLLTQPPGLLTQTKRVFWCVRHSTIRLSLPSCSMNNVRSSGLSQIGVWALDFPHVAG